jgi:hypothetical protein
MVELVTECFNMPNHAMQPYLFALRILILLALLALPACAIVPTLVPALGFVEGVAEIPPGQYLFVEFYSSTGCSGSGNCPCPAPGPVRPAYSYSSGVLHLAMLDDRQLPADWTPEDLPPNTVGFFGVGEFNAHIYTITSFPYESDGKTVVIYNVDSQEKIAAKVFGSTYFFNPGQSWVENTKDRQGMPWGCYMTYTSRVTNYGFLTKEQLRNDG